ncbi:hypothetical protein QOZ80_1AG0030710 [Eleusine coracana subsp. coracana]|nr:hypothetical protein QOZ80_1AG0030710 [Eleusine coracana subsp. coracana]
MDGADAFAVPGNPWSLVRGYFSPTTLFLLLNVVIGTIALTSRSHHRRRDDEHQFHYAPPAPIARTSSMMERLRSLGLYRFRSGDFPPEYMYNHHHSSTAADDASSAHEYARSRSEQAARPPVCKADRKVVEPAVTSRAVKKATASETKKLERAPAQPRRVQRAPPRAPVVAAREVVEDAAAVSVDARADDFINRFRQQLQLQRLNYKEMLNRGYRL